MNSETINLRRTLHQYPELSGCEVNTAQRIKDFILKHHPTDIIENVGRGTGLAVLYTFGDDGPTIAIRCELDALPIDEPNELNYRSIYPGISHKCGHDGHMAIVAGLIFWLKEQSFKTGKVILLFQPAEETGKGGEAVLKDEKFMALGPDFLFALHNIPDYPLHSIIAMDKGFSAEVQSLAIRLSGKESHAAEPENGINPTLAISEIIAALNTLNNNDPNDAEFAVFTPVHILMGQPAYGISPANGELHYTIRTWSSAQMDILVAEIKKEVATISETHLLDYSIDWFEHFPASANNHICNEHIIAAAKINNFEIIERPYPFKFGEDFGWFSKEYKTAMFGLGSGINTPALHHADYDFPEEIIDTGMKMFASIIKGILK